MKIRKSVLLFALCAFGAVAAHAGAEAIDTKLASIENGATLQLSENSTFSQTAEISGKAVTIDLNGCTLDFDSKASGIKLTDGAALTIDDSKGGGKIVLNKGASIQGSYLASWFYADNSSITLNNGTIEFAGYSYPEYFDLYNCIVFDIYNDSTFTQNGGNVIVAEASSVIWSDSSTININDGEMNTKYYRAGQSYGLICPYNSSFNMCGGKIKGTAGIGFSESSCYKITGGTFECVYFCIDTSGSEDVPSTLDITGGVFKIVPGIDEDGYDEDYDQACAIGISWYTTANIGGETVVESPVFALSSAGYSTINITGGSFTGALEEVRTSDPNGHTINVSGGTFSDAKFAEYVKDTDYYTDSNGNIVVGAKKEMSISTGAATAALGSDNSEATGFVTTVSGGEINKISWIITSDDILKQTGEYTISGADGEGDFKIGLIITGLYDSAATAKATVNGVAEN